LHDEVTSLILPEIPPVKSIMKNSLSRRSFIKQGALVAGMKIRSKAKSQS
jgi:hypothetical protein